MTHTYKHMIAEFVLYVVGNDMAKQASCILEKGNMLD